MALRRWIVLLLGASALFTEEFVVARTEAFSFVVEHTEAFAADLESGFSAPPRSAKAKVLWKWMNGNVTREGITHDLEVMKQAGIGGVLIHEVSANTIPGAAIPVNAVWKDRMDFAIQEAGRLGLSIGLHNSAGWAGSGGPWITPEHSMQMLTWSETRVRGGGSVPIWLPKPFNRHSFYGDLAVFAFPAPVGDMVDMRAELPQMKTGQGLPGDQAIDGNWDTGIRLGTPSPDAGSVDLTATFEKPFTARALTLIARPWQTLTGELQASEDGETFWKIRDVAVPEHAVVQYPYCCNFPATTARFFRLVVHSSRGSAEIREFDLLGGHRFEDFYGQAGYVKNSGGQDVESIPYDCIALESMIELTANMTDDGQLIWDAPQGDWVVVRMGHTTTGMMGREVPTGADGLQCDKLSTAALDIHWNHMIKPLLDTRAEAGIRSLDYIDVDSWEVGTQNWTPEFRNEFRVRRGYDLATYWPALTGRMVETPQQTGRFLRDIRRTVADLVAENYFEHLRGLANQEGLKLYGETYGCNGCFDVLECSGRVDVPMTEFWINATPDPESHQRNAASSAHVYGRKLVAAEAFTVDYKRASQKCWEAHPASMKAIADSNAFCGGINQLVFHRFAHNPWPQYSPGMTMGQYGCAFDGTQTWWSQGSAWLDYLARCQFLLQQGRFVAEACYYRGFEDELPRREALEIPLPAGYGFDFCATDAVMQMEVENGRLVLPSGMEYRYLVLPNAREMNLDVIRKIRDLVSAGATVLGERPSATPGLEDYPDCDRLIASIASDIWGECDGEEIRENRFGKGRVLQGMDFEEILKNDDVQPDFAYTLSGGQKLNYIHRRTDAAEIYFIANPQSAAVEAECRFRVEGRMPELWHPDTGQIEPAPVWHEEDGRVAVRLRLDPIGSVFVVFRRPAPEDDHATALNYTAVERTGLPKNQLVILNAEYGVFLEGGQNQTINLTEQLAAQIRNGMLDVLADNALAGQDPASGIKKELRVEWVYNGTQRQTSVPENQRLMLPGDSEQLASPPNAELSVRNDGSLELIAWEPGSAEVETASGRVLKADIQAVPEPVEITHPWRLDFPPGRGAPETITLAELISWSDHPDAGVNYFSGTAVYRNTFMCASPVADQRLFLDLGDVKNIAEVTLNGRDLGILWKPPFRVEVTDAVRVGSNELEVRITNLWPNRMIGDEQLPPDCEWNDNGSLKKWPQWLLDGASSPSGRFAFATWNFWEKDDPLLPSGLLGPVQLRTTKTVVWPKKIDSME